MIAVKPMGSKLSTLVLLLWLAGCVPIPFGVPKGTAETPIITSGVFALPDGAQLPYRLYPSRGPVRAVVLALHGYTDSRDGWLILAERLNAAGITVYAPDQSSFGATVNRGHWPGTATLVDEARAMAVQLRAQYPHTKLVLMGESMGGAIGLLLGASANPPPVDEYILSAPAVWGGDAMNPAYRVATKLGDIIIPAKRLTGSSAHVKASDNQAALIAFGKDPLTIHAPTIHDVAGLVALMGQAQAACGAFNKPALILYGGHDELVPAEAMRKCWSQIPQTAPVVLAYYPPDYHLIERDLERATPTADIIGYILGQGVQSEAPSAATVFLAGG
ncbi:MAG TPA: alpha/beta fold hydrolase [Acidocella sp.]|nr:alpha/beta fold hydrolase [Acidocella sp.]